MCRTLFSLLKVVKNPILPEGWKREMKELLKISWPIVISEFLIFTTHFVSLAFCGHLGNLELDGASLALSVIDVFALSVLEGISTASETLFTQTFGSPNKHKLGTLMQQSVLILWLCCLPCTAFIVNTEHLLLALGIEAQVASLAQQYTILFIPCLPIWSLKEVLLIYLEAQSIVLPSMLIIFMEAVINAAMHALFFFNFKLGMQWSPVAITIANLCSVVMLLSYARLSKVYTETWTGFSTDCFLNWKLFFGLAIPGVAMTCLEWWILCILNVVAGTLGEVPLGAHSIASNLETVLHTIPIGLSCAATVRVGNSLGANKPEAAMVASRMSILVAVVSGVALSLVTFSLKGQVPKIFSQERDVISLGSYLIQFMSIDLLFDTIQVVLSGVILAAGRQKKGMIVNFVACYVIGLPVGICLMLLTDLNVAGAWMGLIVSNVVTALAYLVILWRTDWCEETEEAQKRTGAIELSEISNTETSLSDEQDDIQLYGTYETDTERILNSSSSKLTFRVVLERVCILSAAVAVLLAGILLRYLVPYPVPND